MPNFFSKFPYINYDIDGQGTFLTLTNITRNVDVNELAANNAINYQYYDIQDGERPDTVSYNLYGTASYYWTFFIMNNSLRTGLDYSWPLSAASMENMFEREYDPYSVITFKPDESGEGPLSGLIQMVPLKEEYLPYIRLYNSNLQHKAKILKYDASRLQLVIYDIVWAETNEAYSREAFLDEVYHYFIRWDNPYESETDEYDACEALRKVFIADYISNIEEYDSGIIPDPAIFDDIPTAEEIEIAKYSFLSSYILSKKYVPAPRVYRWQMYREAASLYFRTEDDVDIAESALDAVMTGLSSYLTFYDVENTINSSKEKIRVVQPERISEFVTAYNEALNGN